MAGEPGGFKPLYSDQHDSASVLVAAFHNQAALLALPEPQQFHFLHSTVYLEVDAVVNRHRVCKLYGGPLGLMLATNVAEEDADHAATLLRCAREVLQHLEQVRLPSGEPLGAVMALSTGAISSGLIGSLSLTYQLVGRSVSLARELSETQEQLPLVATRSFRDALPPRAGDELVSVGRVSLACCPTEPQEVFTLPAYRNLPLNYPAPAEAPAVAPRAPEVEEGTAPGGTASSNASEASAAAPHRAAAAEPLA